jgi:DNA primase
MFAVMDAQGRTIAFSGRALEEPLREELAPLGLSPAADATEKPAKYYNSPESPIYRKREALFGIHQARQAIRSSEVCVLVEGNFDVVGLHARGIKNVVAPLGTAFTLEQGQQIRRFCSDVILLFDGDDAGRRAVHASREVCQKVELSTRVARLPDGMDPDELARREGRAGVERVLSAARGLLEYLIRDISERPYMKDDAQARVARLKEAFAVLASEKNPTVRLELKRHVDLLAQSLGFAAETRTIRSLEVEAERAFAPSEPERQIVAAPRRARSPDRRSDISLAILGALLDFPELVDAPEAGLAAELLEGDEALALGALRQIWELGEATNSELVLAKLPTSIHPFARARLAAPRHARVEDAQAELSGNVRQLKALVLSREKKSVVEELERAQRSGDREQEDMLLAEYFRKVRQHKVVAPE